jgi:AcrR family transcriptional regulator
MAVSPRASRRSTQAVRTLILDAAERLFETHGYAQTTMRAVATEAGISLSVLYRHFPGKEGLFSATLLAPFLASFEAFAAAWSDQIENPWDDERLVGEFVRDLYGNLAKHRPTLITLLAAGENTDTRLLDEVRQGLETGLADLRLMAEHEADRRRWFSPETVRYSNTFVIAMITGIVLIGPWLDPISTDEPADELIRALTAMALHGMRLAPPTLPQLAPRTGQPDTQKR